MHGRTCGDAASVFGSAPDQVHALRTVIALVHGKAPSAGGCTRKYCRKKYAAGRKRRSAPIRCLNAPGRRALPVCRRPRQHWQHTWTWTGFRGLSPKAQHSFTSISVSKVCIGGCAAWRLGLTILTRRYNMNSPQQHPGREIPPSAKRAYQRPELQIYGDLGRITEAVGAKGNPDGATSGAKNTHK